MIIACLTGMIHADLMVVNAKVRTLDDRNAVCDSFAVKDGAFIDTGDRDSLGYLRGPDTKVIDAEGRTVVPGFNDAHCHPLSLRGQQLLQVDCSPAKVGSIADIVALIRDEARRTPKGSWILAGSYDFAKLAEKRHPTREELDLATTDHPVHLRSQTCHIGVVNTPAFKLAGITNETPDPFGGEFERDARGVLTGVCKEEAHFLFVTGMGSDDSFVPPYSDDQLVTAVARACAEYNAAGITSVGDALVGVPEIKAYQEARRRNVLNARVNMIVLDSNLARMKAAGLKTGFGDPMLRLGGIKSFADGAIAGHTAWLSEEYGHRPGYFGIPTKSPADIEALVMEAHAAGFQMEIHANGDKAIEMVLDAYQKAQEAVPAPDRRHRIAHCTVVTPRLLDRIRGLGVVVLPFSTYVYEHGDKMGPYGKRTAMMFAHRSFLDHGIPVAGSSDNPCATANVMIALQAMVTRTSSDGTPVGLEQKISAEEALRIYTRGSAYATHEETIKGAIQAGMLADFAMLSGDACTVDPFGLSGIRVLGTWLGGRAVYKGS